LTAKTCICPSHQRWGKWMGTRLSKRET